MNQFQNIRSQLQKFIEKQFQIYGAMELSEQAVPSYRNKFAIMRYVFWTRIRTAVNAAWKDRSPGICLDFGSGTGIVLPFLAHNNDDKIYAFDIAPQSLKMLSELRDEFKLTNLEILSDFEAVKSLPDHSIDTITALDVFEHLENLDDVLEVLNSKMSPNAILIVSSPTETWLYKFMRNFGGKEYHGHYHHNDAKGVERSLANYFKVHLLKRIFPILEYFRIVKASKSN